MALTVDQIVELYERKGARQYGSEAVSQTQHALQCASLAADGGAPPELVAACLLHDIGHLVAERPLSPDSAVDDVHRRGAGGRGDRPQREPHGRNVPCVVHDGGL